MLVVNGYIMEVALMIMPVGLYTRKGKNGRTMYFRDGKLISKKSYTASRSRRSGRKPSTKRTRSIGNPRRKVNMARYRRPAIPHPSITGMASGLAIVAYLSKGAIGTGGQSPSVIAHLQAAKYTPALSQLSANAMSLITSAGGQKTLTKAVTIAAIGGVVRKWFPTIKLGGNKLYFRV